MSKLEMVYLMKVSLHLNTMKDVLEFENINKKCSTAIQSLKVNPWFNNKEDIEKFYKIFKPPTCNCNGFEIDDSVLLKAERIRNYLFGKINFEREIVFYDEETEPMIENENKNEKLKIIIPKVESIETNAYKIIRDEKSNLINQGNVSIKTYTYASVEIIELLIQNLKPNLKINCDEDFFMEFEQTFRKLQVDMNNYPKQIIINMSNETNFKNIFNLFQISNQDKIICIWKKRYLDSKVKDLFNSSKVKIYCTFIDLEIMEKNNNIVLMLDNEKKNEFSFSPENLFDEEERSKYFDLMNKICSTKIKISYNPSIRRMRNFSKQLRLRNKNDKIKLLECVKEIDAGLSFGLFEDILKFKLPFLLEGIEVLKHNGIFEISEKNDLKVLELNEVNEINYFEQENEKEWVIKNSIDYFQKLTKLDLRKCKSIEILSKLKNLEFLYLFKCESCNINIDSMNLKEINLNCNNSKFKLKIYRNDIKFTISDSSFVDIKIGCEEGIKPNIEITNCRRLKIKSNNEMGNIRIEKSNNISFNEGFKCELIQLTNSEITNGLIEAKVVRLVNVLKTCPINLNKANEIVIVKMNNYIFRNNFKSCKKLVIDECNGCNFDLRNNQIEEMKVLKCKSTNIEGTLPNIKSFVSIENNECKLPIPNNIITTDEEIIELKENMKIVTDKKQLIIRNGNYVRCEIESLIKCDITFENCHNIDLKLKNELFGTLEFDNCQAFLNQNQFGNALKLGEVDSLIVNNSKDLNFRPEIINKSIKIKDSELDFEINNERNITVDDIEIENSNVQLQNNIVSNKCVIINSKTDLEKIANYCKEELILKKMEGKEISINQQVKKITFENYSKLQCYGDLKGKEVKLIRCSDMKLRDTSNSIQMESCQNIEVKT